MRKLKKTLSFGIVVALMLSMVTMPQHASAAFNTISENFDSWTSLSDADTGKWVTNKAGGITGAKLTAVEGHGNVLEITSDKQISFHIGDAGENDEKSYKLSFSFKNNAGALYTWMSPWNSSTDTNPSNAGATTLFKASGGTADKAGQGWLTTNRNDVSGLQGFKSQLYLGDYTVSDWYNVEAILDYETRLVKMNFLDAEGNLLGTQAKPMDKYAYAHRFVMSNWGAWLGSVYVDDIKMEETAEKVTVLTDENFETATNWGDVVGGIKWRQFEEYRSEGSLKNTNLIVNSERNGVATKAVSTCGNSNKLDWWAGGAIYEGTWKLNFKFYFDGYLTSFFGGLADSSASSCARSTRQEILGLPYDKQGLDNGYDASGAGKGSTDRKLAAFSTGGTAGRSHMIAEVDPNVWYEYEVIIDLDNKIAHVSLSRDGKKIAGRRNYSLVGSPIANGFDRFGFFTWDNKSFVMDDLKVERLMDYKSTVEDYIITQEDFTNMVDTDLTKNGWKFTKGTAGTIEDGALKLTANEVNLEKWITNTNNTDTIKVKYDVMTDNGIVFADLVGSGMTHQNWNWIGVPISAFVTSSGVYALEDAAHEHNKIASAENRRWITVESVISYNADKTQNTITTTVRDRETGELLAAGEKGNPATVPLTNRDVDRTAITNTNLQILRFISYSANPSYIDNVVVSEYYDEPIIDSSRVTFTDADGNEISDFDNVSTALKNITFDFGAEMNAQSAAQNITIEDEEGNTVAFVGDVVDKAYELTLTDVLAPETIYTLTVNKNIESAIGVTLPRGFSMEFTTGKAICTVEKAELHSATGKLSNIQGLTTGATVTVKSTAFNTYTTNKSAVVMVGYYNGDRLVNVQLEPVTLTAGKKTNISENFILPDMTNVTDVNVFIWDSTTGMVPYCNVLELGK